MEIDKAIRESGDRRLKTKYEHAIYVIQRALALYSLVLSFSPLYFLGFVSNFVIYFLFFFFCGAKHLL